MIRNGLFAILTIVFLHGCDQTPENTDATIEVQQVTEEFPGQVRLDSLTALLDNDPDNADLLNERAKVFLDVDQTNFALADAGRALLRDSTVAKYYLTISDVYFRLN